MEPATLATLVLVIATLVIGVVVIFIKKIWITWVLCASFIIIFLVQGLLEPDLWKQAVQFSFMLRGGSGFIPFHSEVGFSLYGFLNNTPHTWFTPITSLFTHVNLLHLFMNSIFLMLIGLPLEKKMGRPKFFILFIAAGVLGSLMGGMLGYFEFYGLSKGAVGIGASGAIYGIMGCYFFLYPNDKVWFFLNAPIWAFVLVYFLINAFLFMLMRSQLTEGGSHISYEGHMAGLVGGIIVGVVYKYVAKVPLPTKEPKTADLSKLDPLAKTKRQKDILQKINNEDEEDIRSAWLEEFAGSVKCPKCGRKDMSYSGFKLTCKCGEKIRL